MRGAGGAGDKEPGHTSNLSSLLASSNSQLQSIATPVSPRPPAAIRGLNSSFDFFALPMPQAGVGKIVFASNRDGLTQIYLMNADGSGQTSLSDNSGNDDNPRWSPQGSTILF